MNSKGQAFSVFQLLISAIVAFAILYILLTIIGGITPPGRDPGTTTKTMISDRLNNPGSLDVSDVVVRFDQGANLAPTAITEGTGITPDRICILKGDYAGESGMDFAWRGKALYYEGTSAIDTRIGVICERAETLNTILTSDFGMDVTIGPDEGATDESADVRCGSGCEGTKTCCAVILQFK